jgi:hypothetical protein
VLAGRVVISEPRVIGCHDKGPKKTPPEACDRLSNVEQALARAIEQSATCLPTSASGGSIEYVADVSFSRKKINVVVPKEGRSGISGKPAAACAAAVRQVMQQSVSIDGLAHEHARYKIGITATYPASSHN